MGTSDEVMDAMDTTPEKWAGVVGCESEYEVSNRGRVRSLKRRAGLVTVARDIPKILTSFLRHGYARVILHKKGKRVNCFVHRLVLEAFIGPCPDGHATHHKDNNRSNNSVSNLMWATPSQNTRFQFDFGTMRCGTKHHNCKLTDSDVVLIREAKANGARTLDLARRYYCHEGTIRNIVNGRTRRHALREPEGT